MILPWASFLKDRCPTCLVQVTPRIGQFLIFFSDIRLEPVRLFFKKNLKYWQREIPSSDSTAESDIEEDRKILRPGSIANQNKRISRDDNGVVFINRILHENINKDMFQSKSLERLADEIVILGENEHLQSAVLGRVL